MVVSQRDADQSRALIMDAAEEAFARSGYEGTTFSEICEAAGVSRGLPSYFFGNKESLYRAVVGRAADRLRACTIDPLRRKERALSVGGALELFVDTYVDYLARNPNVVRLLQWEMLADPTSARPFAPTGRLFTELLEIFQRIQRKNSRVALGPADVLASVVALCFFPFMLRIKILGMESINKRSVQRAKQRTLRLLHEGI